MGKKYVYFFGGKRADGAAKMKNLLGGKGANLAEMVNIGIPVPAGFTITTEVCTYYSAGKQSYPKQLAREVQESLRKIERLMGAVFGDAKNPLLVSVRSGARASMPGMMDTVLNLGLNDITVQGLIQKSGNERFAFDSYRRFVQMFSDVVFEVGKQKFEHEIEAMKKRRKVTMDVELTAADLRELVATFKEIFRKHVGKPFPQDPQQQLWAAVGAVFRSWNNARAVTYRRLNKIPDDWGTAVNVQAMVFGNMGDTSGTGVAFTRNPNTGEKIFYGEFLVNAQGEDVVAGIRTPRPVSEMKQALPAAYRDLMAIQKKLERHYRDMQDIEFTVQENKLYMLQCRTGKRFGVAAVKIAVDLVKEKLITKKEAILRVQPEQLDQLLHPMIDPKAAVTQLGKGLPASPGAAVGRVVFSAEDAESWASKGEKTILCRIETSPEDIGGMVAAQGILTARGGMTSHAAVVARGMGKCCVAGCGDAHISYELRTMRFGSRTLKEGDWMTLDGTSGRILQGVVPTVDPDPNSKDFRTLMSWADGYRRINIRTNADTPHDSAVAVSFGAEGIGLCRTEHMFFEGDRIDAVREMILAETLLDREKALAKLLPYQREDFIGIFKAMGSRPVTIRLLDPPLHEFLPHTEEEVLDLAKKSGHSAEKLREKNEQLKELNPMLGHRGCRLGIVFPEINRMQARAILEAACICRKNLPSVDVHPEIMVPLVADVEELRRCKADIVQTAEAVFAERKTRVAYTVGTMIEIPRAAITADRVAEEADFFSFGTNDLTQMAFGLSRDDAGKFLPKYVELKVFKEDPFQVLDQAGVGELMIHAIQKGRKTKPKLKIGICGEHGGEPSSVMFCARIGLDYVSCSPYRVPIARLAAAHAALR